MSKILIDEATVTLVLEALEGLKSIPGGRHELHELNAIHRKHDRAITALREAQAERPAQCAPAEDGVCEALNCPNHKPAQQEPWGACVYGRVFVGRLPEHARKFSEDEGVPIQWLYTSPQSQRKPLTDDHTKLLWHEARRCIGPRWMVFKRLIEAAHNIKENT